MKKIMILAAVLCMMSQLQCEPDINWVAPVDLSNTSVNSTDPQIVMDSNGNVTAAWVENGVVKASFQPVGMSFGAAATLSGASASSPRLAVDNSGNVSAVWLNSSGAVIAANLPFGGSWSSGTNISLFGGASSPRVSVTSSGSVVVVWVRGGAVESSSRTLLGLFSLVVTITTGNADVVELQTSSGGTTMAVWHTIVTGQDQLFSSTSTVLGTWTTPKSIVATTSKNNFPKLAIDGNGNATVVWYQYDADFTDVFVKVSQLPSGASSWSTPVSLSSPGFGNPANFTARVKTDTVGNVFVLWSTSYNGSTYDIQSSVQQLGQSFTNANTLVADNFYAFKGDIAINSLSDTVIGYMLYDGMNTLIQSVESLAYGAFVNNYTSPMTLSSGSSNGFPKVASTVTGGNTVRGAAVWVTTNGMNQIIAASTGTATVVLPPTSLMVVQSSNTSHSPVFTEYYNTVSWTASTDPDLNQYAIFKNGVFVRVIDPSMTQYIDHNVVQMGAVTYGVSALTADNAQSAIATISYP